MAVIQVSTDTQAALLNALATANSGDTIQFTTAGSITLSATLSIGKSVTIDGAATGGGTVTLQGDGSFTDVTVTAGTVTLTNLVIAGGHGMGAAGAAGTSANPDGGAGGDAAGGVFNNGGTLTVSNVSFVDDTATGGAGGAGYSFLTYDGAGGGAGGAGGNGAGAYSAQNIPDLIYGGQGSAGGTDGQSGVDGQSGNPPGGGIGAFGGYGGIAPSQGAAWVASTGGSAGDPGTGLNGLGGGGGGGGAGGTSFQASGGLEFTVPCFAAGTRIATQTGEVAVDHLRVGMMACLADGGLAEIVWIGHRRVRVAGHPRPHDVNPVRVAADAFGPGQPKRDLYLSPDHAVFVAGVLVPIRYLLNGATIAAVSVESVTYYHVELARHAVLLAEGLPAESFLDTGNRGAFANGGGAVMAHPDFALKRWENAACAKLVTDGPVLEALRTRLLRRAEAQGFLRTPDADPVLLVDGTPIRAQGCVDTVWRFVVPPSARDIRLVSRSAVPAEIFAHHADGRRLGVAVAAIMADGVAVPLEACDGGWHAREAGLRWTDGNAVLPVAGARVVELDLAPLLRYWDMAATEAARLSA
jgi:hypothetical protein